MRICLDGSPPGPTKFKNDSEVNQVLGVSNSEGSDCIFQKISQPIGITTSFFTAIDIDMTFLYNL